MNFEALNPLSIKTGNNLTTVHYLLDGPAGKVEAVLTAPEQANPYQAIAVVCHPHPLHGGSLTNKVTHFVAKSLNELGIPVLRFNFRGVGQSEGEHANAIGEQDDLKAAVHSIQALYPKHDLWLAGFSFGAYIALSTAVECNARKLITVAPAVHLYDFSKVSLPDCDWLLIQGDADEIVPSEQAVAWAESLSQPPTIVVFNEVGHFFHGKLNELRDSIINHIQS